MLADEALRWAKFLLVVMSGFLDETAGLSEDLGVPSFLDSEMEVGGCFYLGAVGLSATYLSEVPLL